MKRIILTVVATAALVSGAASIANAAEEFSYGRNLMTEQERAEHRERIRNMQTEKERNAYRQQLHQEMQKRAAKKGLSLPDEPGQRGKGLNYPGAGSGQGGGGGRGR